MTVRLRGDRPLRGRVRPTSDKSISHRALMLGAVAEGVTSIAGLNPGGDVASTLACLRALGVRITTGEDGRVRVEGRGGTLRCPTGPLDCGNSGTTMRLLAGVVASQSFTTTLDGDVSLRGRPMRRIAVPLRGLGARVEGPDNAEHAPLVITGPVRRGGSFSSPVASAQIKSAVLLAGAIAGLRVRVEEPGASRDHTERMLNAFGVECRYGDGFALVDPEPGQRLRACDLSVAADPSAAALLAACALAVPDSRIELTGVTLNPRRTGFVGVLRRMGATVEVAITGKEAGEEIGTLKVASGPLQPTLVEVREIPSLVDEVPALAVVAAGANGTTVFEGVAELRTKESDRLDALVALLAAFGIEAEAGPDRLAVHGGTPRRVAELPPTADHRILMASAALGLAARAHGGPPAPGFDPAAAGVSDPQFFAQLQELEGADRD